MSSRLSRSVEHGNIFEQLPDDLRDEVFETLVHGENIRIKRIVSKGHTSPDTGWYDQDQNEWVIVLRGNASILFENETVINLEEGGYVNIQARKRHRVIETSTDPETVWLAVRY